MTRESVAQRGGGGAASAAGTSWSKATIPTDAGPVRS